MYTLETYFSPLNIYHYNLSQIQTKPSINYSPRLDCWIAFKCTGVLWNTYFPSQHLVNVTLKVLTRSNDNCSPLTGGKQLISIYRSLNLCHTDRQGIPLGF